MTDQTEGESEQTGSEGVKGRARDDAQDNLEAEQESAAAMDADVPQPPGADRTTEGQPS